MTEKLCTRCETVKVVTDFNRSKVTKDGLHAWCRACVSDYGRSRRKDVKKAKYMKAYNAKYNETHHEHKLHLVVTRRAKLHNAEHEEIDRMAVWGRDEGHCRRCTIYVPYEEMELDHIVPFSKGGTHTWNNVQTLCTPCNRQKGNKLEPVRV